MIPRIAITPGEPAGVGPELLLQLAASRSPEGRAAARWIAVADPALLAERARVHASSLVIREDDGAACVDEPGVLTVAPTALGASSRPGELDPRNARYVLDCLDLAIDGCLGGRFDALATGPVHKAVIADSGVPFTGHTEYLATRTGARDVLMVLAADALRVALVTTHLPLAKVAAQITTERVARSLELLIEGLRTRFGIAAPRILVAGLNPHAGEGGHLGREEIEVIGPVCEAARARGESVLGPLPADTLFTPSQLAGADGVLAMYHDQGLPVLKHVGFGRAINVTFGLPIVRSSVDHGTALDLAGSGRADPGSFAAAIEAAVAMAGRRHEAEPR